MFRTTAIDTLKQDKKCQACWYIILSTMSGSTTTSALPQRQGQAQPQAQGNVTVIYDKALLQALEGNYSGALSLYKKVLTIDPYDPYTLTSIGRVLYDLHNYTGAVQYFDKALALDPRHVSALDYKGLALYRLGNYSEALASYNKGISLDPYMYDMLDNKPRLVFFLLRSLFSCSLMGVSFESMRRQEVCRIGLNSI